MDGRTRSGVAGVEGEVGGMGSPFLRGAGIL